jgi:hypothetical protein
MEETITLKEQSIPIVNNQFEYSFTTENSGTLANSQTNMDFSGTFLSPTQFKGKLQLPEGPVTIKASMTSAAIPTTLPASTEITTPVSAGTAFPAKIMVNGTDVLSVLLAKGFTYTGGEELGGCTASCAQYDDTPLGISATVYADAATIIFTADLKSGVDMSAQVKPLNAMIEKIYGHDMDLWIANANAAVLGGKAQDGQVGNFDIHMELDNDGSLLLIELSSAS